MVNAVAGVQINSDDDTITVIDPRYGELVLNPIMDQLIWFGKFGTGKLAIYPADLKGTQLRPCYALIFVMAGQVEAAMDGVGHVICDIEIPVPAAMDMVLESITAKQTELAAKQKEVFFAHGPATLH